MRVLDRELETTPVETNTIRQPSFSFLPRKDRRASVKNLTLLGNSSSLSNAKSASD